MFCKIFQCVSQPPYVGMKEEEGGRVGRGLARTALRTLRANAECAYIGFHLHCFPFCHLLILCVKPTRCSSIPHIYFINEHWAMSMEQWYNTKSNPKFWITNLSEDSGKQIDSLLHTRTSDCWADCRAPGYPRSHREEPTAGGPDCRRGHVARDSAAVQRKKNVTWYPFML